MAINQPNIVVIMSDDVGVWNIGAYPPRNDGRAYPKSRQTRQ